MSVLATLKIVKIEKHCHGMVHGMNFKCFYSQHSTYTISTHTKIYVPHAFSLNLEEKYWVLHKIFDGALVGNNSAKN